MTSSLPALIEKMGKAHTVKRPAETTYVNGRAVTGVVTTLEVKAHFQPMTGRELQRLPEGERSKEMRVGWTAEPLRSSGEEGQSDVVEIEGDDWEVSRVEDWSESGGFYRLYVTRVSR